MARIEPAAKMYKTLSEIAKLDPGAFGADFCIQRAIELAKAAVADCEKNAPLVVNKALYGRRFP